MELPRITPEFYDVAWKLMCDSFPAHEMRSREEQWAIVDRDDFCPHIIMCDDQFAGIVFYWVHSGLCFVEHFATLPSLRGRGIGAQAMSVVVAHNSLTVLEIDPVVDDISTRRRGFYERVGFVENPYPYHHPGYAPLFTRHPLIVMSSPSILTPTQFDTFKDFNYNTVCSKFL